MTRLAAALLVLALAAGPATAQDAGSADAFLRKIYSHYKAKGQPIDLTGPKAETVFDPSLAQLLRQDVKALKGEVGLLEGDPICDCQDYDIRTVQIDLQPDGAGRLKASASFHNLDADTKVDFDLASVNGQWRIANIHEPEIPDLRKALEQEIASIKQAAKPH